MIAKTVLGAFGAVALFCAATPVVAQEVDADVAYYDDGYADLPVIRERPAYGPRVYSYERRADDVDVAPALPYPVGGCGTYHFWDGFECRDARNRTTPTR